MRRKADPRPVDIRPNVIALLAPVIHSRAQKMNPRVKPASDGWPNFIETRSSSATVTRWTAGELAGYDGPRRRLASQFVEVTMTPSELTIRDAHPIGQAAHTSRLHREIALSAELAAASQCDPAAAWRSLGGSEAGLHETDAAARLRRFGANKIAQERQAGIVRELIGRTRNPLNALLLTLAAVSYFLGDVRAAIIISAMVILSIVTAFIQEHRSNQAAAKLRALVKTTASVKRPEAALQTSKINGFVEIPMEEIVPGDIVALSAGDMIPADLRLLSAKDLFVNQSTLTGEAMPMEKSAAAVDRPPDDAFDLPNICFMGSNVVSGYGTGV